MTRSDMVIALRKYKGLSRRKTAELMNISIKEIVEIEQRVFKDRGRASMYYLLVQSDSGEELDDSASLELA